MARHLDPSQVSLLVHRPRTAPPLRVTAERLGAWLGEDTGAPALRLAPTPERVAHGVHVFRTPAGVPVLVLPRPGAPLVNIGVFTCGGAATEPTPHEGLARLTAHATLKGTRRRSGADIALEAESLGGSFGVSAGLESLGWALSVPVRQLEAAVELLADVVQHPAFPAGGVDTERTLAAAEVERLRDDMYRFPMRLAVEAAWRGHPYARSVLGTASSLAALTRDDVLAQHGRILQQGGGVIGVVGDVDAAEVAALVQRHVDTITGGVVALPEPAPWPATLTQHVETRDKQQTALAMLFGGPARRDPERHAARVLAAVVSGLGGRFFEQLRDRQSLAYTVAAYPVERRAGGLFAAYIATAPDREEEARAGLLAQFAMLVEEPIREDELERARQYLVGSHAIAQQSGASVLADLVDAWSFGDGLHELHEHADRHLAVTAEDVHALAQRWFDPARRVEGVVRGARSG